MYKNLKTTLELFGYNKIQIAIFLEILELGEINILQLSIGLGIDRRKIKKNLEVFANDGFITMKDKKYQLNNLNQILIKIDFQNKELARLRSKVATEIEEIKYNLEPDKRQVVFYRGKNAYVSLFNSMLEDVETIYHLGDESSFIEVVGEEYFKLWVSKRISKSIHAKDITFTTQQIKALGLESKINTSLTYLDQDFNFPGSIICFGGKVALFYSAIPKCVLINDQEFYNFFIYIWEMTNALVKPKNQ